jgi:ASC-1-like (ASCH) protein
LTKHKLKIQPEYFKAVCTGKKSFEIRNNDRDFKAGDTLLLQEFIPQTTSYTGRVVERKITYITNYAQQENFVVMAIV